MQIPEKLLWVSLEVRVARRWSLTTLSAVNLGHAPWIVHPFIAAQKQTNLYLL